MPKHNKKFETPSNKGYVSQNRLRKNKVRRMAKDLNVDEATAGALWDAAKAAKGTGKAKPAETAKKK